MEGELAAKEKALASVEPGILQALDGCGMTKEGSDAVDEKEKSAKSD